jgi:hypothetical protein
VDDADDDAAGPLSEGLILILFLIPINDLILLSELATLDTFTGVETD